jgi:hypothetical protein
MPTLVLAGLLYVGAALAVLPTVARHGPRRSRFATEADRRPSVVFGGAIGPARSAA